MAPAADRPARALRLGRGWTALRWIVIVAVATIGWINFGPTAAGGHATYIQVAGQSMLPTFHQGDLVVTRQESSYHVGQVAAYHNGQLHEVVMHRIIAIRGNHFVFRGDNNDFNDTFEPTASQIVGAKWFSAGGVGGIFSFSRTPLPFALILSVLGMLAVSAYLPNGSRRRRRHHAK